jgi:hypothetical protein
MIFGIGDVSKSLASGEAGYNTEEADMLRSIFGKVAPTGSVPPFVEEEGKDKLKEGADVIACMFALHYFFKDKETFQGLLNNISQNLQVGGYFVACFFDGKKVFDLLKKKKKGESVAGTDRNTALWRITKQYENTILPSDDTGFGIAIQNKFISIGAEHREYLVSMELLEKKMREIGCLLLTPADQAALGLPASTETFDVTYKRAPTDAYPMIKTVQEYSFLNRWCIFKRYSGTVLNEEEEEAVRSATAENVVESPEAANESVAANAAAAGAGSTVKKRPATAAWQAVPASGNAPAASLLQEEKAVSAKVTGPGVGAIAELAVSRKGNEKALTQGLATAIAGVTAAVEPPEQEYEPSRIFAFSNKEQDVSIFEDDDGKVKWKDAARYISPYYPFEIEDRTDPKKPVVYPSILHFMGGMEYKVGAGRPEDAENIFSIRGSIHSKFVRESLLKGAPLDQAQLLREADEIARESPTRTAKTRKNLGYNETRWIVEKDKYLKQAYQARYEKDEKFRQILEKLREMDKYLLYRPDDKLNTRDDLGGILKQVKKKGKKTEGEKKLVKVEGINKLGKLLMTLGGFRGFGKIEPGVVEEADE